MTRLHSNNQAPLPPRGLPEGFTLPGGYVIEAPLGSGGFGAVYAGRDPQLERAVAVKVLRRSLDERALKRFRDEGRLLAKLQQCPHGDELGIGDVHVTADGEIAPRDGPVAE